MKISLNFCLSRYPWLETISKTRKGLVLSRTRYIQFRLVFNSLSIPRSKISCRITFHTSYFRFTKVTIKVKDVICINLHLHEPGPVLALSLVDGLLVWGTPKLILLVFLFLELIYLPAALSCKVLYYPGPGTLFLTANSASPGSFFPKENDLPFISTLL